MLSEKQKKFWKRRKEANIEEDTCNPPRYCPRCKSDVWIEDGESKCACLSSAFGQNAKYEIMEQWV